MGWKFLTLQDQLYTWENLWLAYQKAGRGKRGRATTAEFELFLADYLLELQAELRQQTYPPGRYHSFYIHEPKRRLISASCMFCSVMWCNISPVLITPSCALSCKSCYQMKACSG